MANIGDVGDPVIWTPHGFSKWDTYARIERVIGGGNRFVIKYLDSRGDEETTRVFRDEVKLISEEEYRTRMLLDT